MWTCRGRAFDVETPAEADVQFRAWEAEVATMEDALAMLEQNANTYAEWLATLNESDLAKEVPMPFKMGNAPVSKAIGFAALHTDYHQAQLDYLQTILGDRNW